MNALRLYLRYVGISVRGQMQYRASFFMMALGHFAITGVEFVAIWGLFARFKTIKGWTLAEFALFYGIVSVAFAVAEGVGRGFDVFPGLVRMGEFDRLLVRPRSTVLQVAAREVQLMRVGRLAQGLVVLFWGVAALDVAWTPAKAVVLIGAVLGGACLFTGLLVLQATLAFWTTESLEVVNCLTYGGVECAQFPLTIYRPWFRRFFTFVVPLACINYFPVHAILGRADPLGTPAAVYWAAPLVGVLFLLVTLKVWRFGVRHYRSTGS